jgi:hypothetical protein
MERMILLLFVFCFVGSPSSTAQLIDQEKKTVTFLFGTIHSRTQDGKTVSIEIPLGTGFFVYYPDLRGGPEYGFVYLVTAKHVLKDLDGSFLKEIKIRLNFKEPVNGKQCDFGPVRVTNDDGNLLWFQDTDDATDVAVIPLLPDQKQVDFATIPVALFADDELLKR